MPALDTVRVRRHLQASDLLLLFVEELGWDRHRARPLEIFVDGQTYTLRALAEKRGMVAFGCDPDSDGNVPPYAIRRKIEAQASQTAHEHLIVYVDRGSNLQVWQWVKREPGRPAACREHTFSRGQSGEALIQKLQVLSFSLEEEEELTVTTVAGRARKAFDRDRVTKKFYERFKAEHTAFLGFIQGMRAQGDREWYASLMLNRLMFVYFIQKKGFLDGDRDYLRNRLRMTAAHRGKDSFHSFYRYFLLRLFHEGLGHQEHSSDLDALLGRVPYLNGGLFDVHDLERQNDAIEINDEAFARVFDFFDAYQWHLDERPLRRDDEINPDVLGYIFEKYINQKQMGAYYTKEDITDYIGKNTIIPFLFDAAREKCPIAFQPDSALWRLLQDDPDRYFYEAVRKGVDIPLPPSIAAGITDVSRREGWNKPADPAYALPTETWREHVARRTRCLDLRAKLQAGDLTSINDVITYNLDIRQFAQDAIETCEGPELLRAFYYSIAGRIPREPNDTFQRGISILDPTCGSGAFLFAALTILEPLYEACLERMESFVVDHDRTAAGAATSRGGPTHFSDFRALIADADNHPNRRYFILKSIILGNLYGVDIMEEAVEICKLRLFLKLVAQVERVEDIEPLPDIDFNIRAGNTLIGFTNHGAVKEAIKATATGQRKLLFAEDDETMRRIDESAEIADRSFQRFQHMQIHYGRGADDSTGAKAELRHRLNELGTELNRYLAREYGVTEGDKEAFAKWRHSHQPFHWYVDFYGIMQSGGFDVIIGNPPYVEYDAKLKARYLVMGYKTAECANLHAFITERSLDLIAQRGRVGLIVPLPAINTTRMEALQTLIKPSVAGEGRHLYVSAFDERPSSLFNGVDQRLIVEIFGNMRQEPVLYTTGINRWSSAARSSLFSSLCYTAQTESVRSLTILILKVKNILIEAALLKRLYRDRTLAAFKSELPTKHLLGYRTAGGRYWKVVLDHPFDSVSLSNKIAYLRNLTGQQAVAVISSSTFWWYYSCHYDMYNLKDYMIFGFRFSDASSSVLTELQALGTQLIESLENNSTVETVQSKTRGAVTSRRYVASRSKAIIDSIDHLLARHYGFAEEQLDFIINYDVKYRMGQEDENDDSTT